MIHEPTQYAPTLQHFFALIQYISNVLYCVSSDTNYYGSICQEFQGLMVIGPHGEPQATLLVQSVISCSKV